MKIAMIGQKGAPAYFGGIERQVEELGARLALLGFNITLYNRRWFSDFKEKTHRGMNIVTLPSIHTKHLDTITHTFICTLHAIKSGADIIHYHGVGPALLSWIPRIIAPRCRVITTFHCIDRKHAKWGFFARFALRIGEWASLKFAHQTIAVSEQIQRYANDAYDSRCVYIPYGVMEAVESKSYEEIQKRFNVETGGYALVVTRLIPHKGVHYLIAAFKKIPTAKKLVIVGDGYFTDSYVKYLRKIASDDKRIVFTGFLDGEILRAIYTHAALVVQPSEAEGLSISLLEAMNYGKAVLASDIPENKEGLGDAGIYFASGNTEDLRRKLEYALDMTLAERSELGLKAKKRIQQLHDWDKIAMDTIRVYKGSFTKKDPKAARGVFIPV